MSCDRHMQLNVLHFLLDSVKLWTYKNTICRLSSNFKRMSVITGVCQPHHLSSVEGNRTKIISHHHNFLHNTAGFVIIHATNFNDWNIMDFHQISLKNQHCTFRQTHITIRKHISHAPWEGNPLWLLGWLSTINNDNCWHISFTWPAPCTTNSY